MLRILNLYGNNLFTISRFINKKKKKGKVAQTYRRVRTRFIFAFMCKCFQKEKILKNIRRNTFQISPRAWAHPLSLSHSLSLSYGRHTLWHCNWRHNKLVKGFYHFFECKIWHQQTSKGIKYWLMYFSFKKKQEKN